MKSPNFLGHLWDWLTGAGIRRAMGSMREEIRVLLEEANEQAERIDRQRAKIAELTVALGKAREATRKQMLANVDMVRRGCLEEQNLAALVHVLKMALWNAVWCLPDRKLRVHAPPPDWNIRLDFADYAGEKPEFVVRVDAPGVRESMEDSPFTGASSDELKKAPSPHPDAGSYSING